MTYIPMVTVKDREGLKTYDIYSRLLKERIILVSEEITDQSSGIIIAQLLYLASESDEDIWLYINSPGGSVTAGLAIYDTMQYIKPNVNTLCIGLAASMGAFLLSGGKKRYALPNSEVMIHEPSTGMNGNASDIFNHAKWLEKLKYKVDSILAKNTKHTIKEIEEATLRDKFMDAFEALEFNIIDEILQN